MCNAVQWLFKQLLLLSLSQFTFENLWYLHLLFYLKTFCRVYCDTSFSDTSLNLSNCLVYVQTETLLNTSNYSSFLWHCVKPFSNASSTFSNFATFLRLSKADVEPIDLLSLKLVTCWHSVFNVNFGSPMISAKLFSDVPPSWFLILFFLWVNDLHKLLQSF